MENSDRRHSKPTEEKIEKVAGRYELEFRSANPGILDLGFFGDDKLKKAIIERVLLVISDNDVELDPEFTKIFVAVKSYSYIEKEGEKWLKFECEVMIFTNQGPCKFDYGICVLPQNFRFYLRDDAQA